MNITPKDIRRLALRILYSLVSLAIVLVTFALVVEPLLLYQTNAAALEQLKADNLAASRMQTLSLSIGIGKAAAILVSLIPAVRGIDIFFKEVSK